MTNRKEFRTAYAKARNVLAMDDEYVRVPESGLIFYRGSVIRDAGLRCASTWTRSFHAVLNDAGGFIERTVENHRNVVESLRHARRRSEMAAGKRRRGEIPA